MTATFEKKSNKIALKRRKRTFPVWVVMRHTRSGDQRCKVIDQYHYTVTDPEKQKTEAARTRGYAMEDAREIANEAAMNYGHGSASVYAGTLTINATAERPDAERS